MKFNEKPKNRIQVNDCHIDVEDLFECRYYICELSSQGFNLRDYYLSDISKICTRIGLDIKEKYQNTSRGVELLKEIKHKYHLRKLNNTQLVWIKSNSRACYWLWLKIKIDNDIEVYRFGETQLIKNANKLKKTPIPMDAHTHEERFSYLKTYLDYWPITTDEKVGELAKIHDRWAHVFNRHEPLKRLSPKDKERCYWTWNYMENSEKFPIMSSITPANLTEIDCALKAVIDVYTSRIGIDLMDLFMLRMNKAWSQKTYRNKLVDKKPLNTYISTSAKKRLDAIAKKNNKKINELIEEMINTTYLSM